MRPIKYLLKEDFQELPKICVYMKNSPKLLSSSADDCINSEWTPFNFCQLIFISSTQNENIENS